MCHLDADMARQGIEELDISDVDLVILSEALRILYARRSLIQER